MNTGDWKRPEQDAEPDDAPPTDVELEELWNPETAAEDVRSIEDRLRPLALKERAWGQQGRELLASSADGSPTGQQEPPEESWEERGRSPVWKAGGNGFVRVVSMLAAVLLVVLFLSDALDWWPTGGDAGRDAESAYVVEALDGAAQVQRRGTIHTAERFALEAGDRVVCDELSSARLNVAHAGWLRMEAGTALRVDSEPRGAGDGWRLYLERGQVTASIFAAPRLFQVGTPSGIAVDLGCAYTASVGDSGETVLTVRGGQVSFETALRKVFVPEGARVVAWPGKGPGTPVWEDASAPLRRAFEWLDGLAETPAAELDSLESQSALSELSGIHEARHSLSLWHLLKHPHPQVARSVMKALLALCPPAGDVDLMALQALEPLALADWRTQLEAGW